MVAAFREDHTLHGDTRPWFERLVAEKEPFAVPSFVWGSFLRLVTNPRIFEVATPRDDAFAFIDAVRDQPGFLDLGPGARHVELLRTICEEADIVGERVPDAVIAAVALEHGCVVATLDRDFARFGSVEHVRPDGR